MAIGSDRVKHCRLKQRINIIRSKYIKKKRKEKAQNETNQSKGKEARHIEIEHTETVSPLLLATGPTTLHTFLLLVVSASSTLRGDNTIGVD